MLRAGRAALVGLLGASWLVAPTPVPLTGSACAEEKPHAVLVVDRGTEGGPLDPLCVVLRAEQVSGKRFLQLASNQYDLQVRFARYSHGTAVCEIANVGNEGNDCLEGAETYWGYWRGNGSGGWESSNEGVDDTVVENGDVEGWSWGRGRNEPPATTFAEGCAAVLEEPEPSPSPSPSASPSPTRSPSPTPTPRKTKAPLPPLDADPRRLDTVPELSELVVSSTPTPSPSRVVLPPSATASGDEEDDDFPVAGVLALVATLGMAAVAAYLVRRRPPVPRED